MASGRSSVPLVRQLLRMGEDGPLVEVEVDTSQAVQAANLGQILEVRKGFDNLSDFLRKVMLPFANTWRELASEIEMKEASLKLTIGVSATGSFFLAKGKTEANLELSLKFIPRKEASA
jgi:hypothetical protein